MQFNSLEFLIFLGFFFLAWPLFRRRANFRYIYFIVASFIFYGWWDWRYLFLLIGSGLIDYAAALAIVHWPTYRKPLLIVSLSGNLGSLLFFKYLDFGIAGLNHILSWIGISANIPAAELILPVGISFYTFQSMSYTIDVYRKQIVPTRNIAHFFAYLSLFPQLVAGPIVRAADLLPQLAEYRPTTEEQRWSGLQLIVLGFFKKLVIADSFSETIGFAFRPGNVIFPSTLYWWLLMAMFAFQIYCDFSGYSDIARGLARWMGYEFPLNFDHPYIASSFSDFWKRWHISLSTWFRDYVYIPLGGSKNGIWATYRNLWITFLLSGLWHGAAWTFLAWGAIHAFYLTIEKLIRWPAKIKSIPGGNILAIAITFSLTLVAWVFFRAGSLSQALSILSVMASFQTTDINIFRDALTYKTLILLGLIAARQIYCYSNLDKIAWKTIPFFPVMQQALFAVLILLAVFLRGPGNTFIYFQF